MYFIKNRKLFLICFYCFIFIALVFCFYFVKAIMNYKAYREFFSDGMIFQEDAILGFKMKPYLNTVVKVPAGSFHVITDELGARVSRVDENVANKVDIMGIGCSFTWGDMVDAENTYLSLLAKNSGLKAINFALPSYGITTSLLTLEKFKFLKPKIVIFGFIVDQIKRSLLPCAPCESPFCRAVPFVDFNQSFFIHKPILTLPQPYYQYYDKVVKPHSFCFNDIYWSWKVDVLRFLRNDLNGVNSRFLLRANNPRFQEEAISFLMKKMVKLCEEIGATLIIVYIPNPADIQGVPQVFSKAVNNFNNNKKVYFVDLTEDFLSYAKYWGKDRLKAANGKDNHPGEEAHRIIAEKLLSIIKKIMQKP